MRLVTKYGSIHETSVLIASVRSEGSGETAHVRSLARAFAARIFELRICDKNRNLVRLPMLYTGTE